MSDSTNAQPKNSAYEQKIIDAFLNRFSDGKKTMRLRAAAVFSGYGSASPGEQTAWIKAAENLEERGLLRLNREKGPKNRQIKTLTCLDFGNLFEASGKKHPGTEAEKARTLITKALPRLEKTLAGIKRKKPGPVKTEDALFYSPVPGFIATAENMVSFLGWLAVHFSTADAKRGMDSSAVADFLHLAETFLKPETWETLTTRALSVRLFRDSKRLEYIMDFADPFISQAKKHGITAPDLSLLHRSFPEATIAGKIVAEFHGHGPDSSYPLINREGIILTLPLSSVLKISRIKTAAGGENPKVLTIENKETFFAFGLLENRKHEKPVSGSQPQFDCCLYTGGFPNRAASAMIRLLSASGFSFYHAGDLDIDGILILQSVMDISGKPVVPVCMDAATFDRCLPFARPLGKEMFRQAAKIRDETRSLPGIAALIRRIEETSQGVEQEIVDYGL